MMKKFIIVLLTISMLVTFGGCTSKQKGEDSKVEEIKKAGKVVVGTAADYPPFEFHKEINGKDEIVGFDIEVAKAIAEDLGVELEIIDMKFEGLLPALVTNDIDFIVAGMSADEERAKSVDFSTSYYEGVQRLVIRKDDSDKLKNPEDFKGFKIGAQKSTEQEDVAENQFTEAEKIYLANITDLVLEVKNKKIDGLILAEPVAEAYVKRNSDLFLADIVLEKEDGYAVAVNKGTADLLGFINKTLDRLIKEDQIDKLIQEATQLSEQ
ncbi:transporter substrate-binding domain-containing protein [Tissierellaceae bacterium BX21]|jgi:polar amino acid transport system substrate-binding protein|uniref:Transporter substrate-binding domain-containing protein n=2 Tax=Paratissierella segnis TaxID=2763679 RepID=A0A926ET32_9FIRM|nr:transporter substrate-binding domain-containing protein [Paratissierella segnis]